MSRFEWYHCDHCGFGAPAELGHRPQGWETLYLVAYVAQDHVPEGPAGRFDACPSCYALIQESILKRLQSNYLHYVDFSHEVFRYLFTGSLDADEKGSNR